MIQKNKQLKKTGKRREEKSAKISPKLERILEYGQEFEQLIKRELETIKNDATTPSKQVSASKKSIIVCATVVEKSGAEIMDNVFETTFADNSNIVLMDPSFDFRYPRLYFRLIFFGKIYFKLLSYNVSSVSWNFESVTF